MGMFAGRKQKQHYRTMAPIWLDEANRHVETINHTANPQTYFSSWAQLINLFTKLQEAEPFVSFSGTPPTEQLVQLKEQRHTSFKDFVGRYLNKSNSDALAALKHLELYKQDMESADYDFLQSLIQDNNQEVQNSFEESHKGKAYKATMPETSEFEIEQNNSESTSQSVTAPEPYKFPPLSLLTVNDTNTEEHAQESLTTTLAHCLDSFRIQAEITEVHIGPNYTRFGLSLAPGVRIADVTKRKDDIAMALSTPDIHIAPIPHQPLLGINVLNNKRQIVYLGNILNEYTRVDELVPIVLGIDMSGNHVTVDLAQINHILISGSAGRGKTMLLHSAIMGLLFCKTPEEVRLILIDTKGIDMVRYNGIPHLLMPVITNIDRALSALGFAVAEMERRYRLLMDSGMKNIHEYNGNCRKDITKPLCFIVIIIDEIANLTLSYRDDAEKYIRDLTVKAHNVGVHIVLSSQRNNAEMMPNSIRSGFPHRIAFSLPSARESKIAIGHEGAEKLQVNGDFLYISPTIHKPLRIQGSYISDQELKAVIASIKANSTSTSYVDTFEQPLFEKEHSFYADTTFLEAVEVALENGAINTAFLQRKLRLGYAKAGRIIDEMERLGILEPSEGSRPRKTLISRDQWVAMREQEN